MSYKFIEEVIDERAYGICEQYYSNIPHLNSEKRFNYFNSIKDILEKTIITPNRVKDLCKIENLPFNDIFSPEYSIICSPNLEEALQYLPPLFALYLFQKYSSEKINALSCEENSFHLKNIGILPYFTKKEFSDLIKDFSIFIENNQKPLIETGWPKYNFIPSPWLFYHLSPNYPIEIPAYIKNYRKLLNYTNDSFINFKDIYSNKPNKSIFQLEEKNKNISLIKNFSYSELGFMEEIRPELFNLKKLILKEIAENLFLDNSDDDMCLKNCLKIFYEYFPKDIFMELYNIEKKYEHLKIFNINISGGLSNLKYILIDLYLESKYVNIYFEKSLFLSLLKRSKFKSQKQIKSYYQILQFIQSEYESEQYLNTMKGFCKKIQETNKNLSRDRETIINLIDSCEYNYSIVSVPIKLKQRDTIENFIQYLEKEEYLNPGSSSINKPPESPKNRITPLELPAGTKWEQIVLKFIDKESIEITGPEDYREVRSFREMGFENRKKLGRPPTVLWDFLRALAHTKGTFSWELLKEGTRNSKIIKDAMDNATKRKHLVKQKLKAIFNLKEDPIIYDRKNKIYQTIFTITSEIEFY